MKITKRLTAAFIALFFLFSAAGCGSAQNNKSSAAGSSSSVKTSETSINVAALKGPTGLSMVKLMSDSEAKKTAGDYKFSIVGSPDEIVSKVTSGSADVAAVPANLAASLYNKTNGKIQIAAVTTLGVLYVLTNGVKITGINDLKGKTVYLTGKGATPEYVFNYILKQNGLTLGKDVKTIYKSQHAELAAQMIAGNVKIAVLPEPFVTQVLMKNKKVKIALNITNEWNKAVKNKSTLSMGCLIVSKKFAQNNKEVFNKFLDEYKASAEHANKNVTETAKLSAKYDIMPEAVAEKAIPNCSIVYIDGSEMKAKIPDFLKVLYTANPKSVGGKLPDDDFYYQR